MTDEQWKKVVEHVKEQMKIIDEEATTTNCKNMGLDPDNEAHRNVSKLNVCIFNALIQILDKGDISRVAAKFLIEITEISTSVLFGNGDIKNLENIIEKEAGKSSVHVMIVKEGNSSLH